jgi:hypothetical protein
MFVMLIGIILGVILGVVIVRFASRKTIGWLALSLGALAFLSILPVFIAILAQTDTGFFPVVSIPLSIACVISGVDAIRKHHRPWQVWTGVALGIIPLLFWIVFAVGEVIYPH